MLVVAACVAEIDAEKTERLPDTRGLKNEVVIRRCDRFEEDAAIRIPGARIVQIGDRRGASEEDYQQAFNARTAAVFTTPPLGGTLPLDRIVQIAHAKEIPVIVDVAWSVPPKENLWKFTRGIENVVVKLDAPASHFHVNLAEPSNMVMRDEIKLRMYGGPRVLIRDSGPSGSA